MVLRDHQVNVYHCFAFLLLNLALFVLDLKYLLLLLLTREYSAIRVRRPNEHVVVQTQVKAPNHVRLGLCDGQLNELRDSLD